MWPDKTLGQREFVVVLDLHQIQAVRMRRDTAGPALAAFRTSFIHSTGRSPAPMVISTPAILRTM